MTEKTTTCPNCNYRNQPSAAFCSRCGSSLTATDGDPFIGKQVGKIVLKKRIGYGGAGAVYKGEHVDLKKLFAVKVLRADLITDEETKARFEREARVLARIQHDNVVSIHDFGHLSGLGPYMAMEWLEGSTLFDERKKRGSLAFDEVLNIFDQLTSAMYFMHTRDIIHRDLKPENMMLISSGNERDGQQDSLIHRKLKVFDFGIALLEDEGERRLTAAGMVVGTPHYMAPEQIIIDAKVDHRADLYATGAILYEMLTGKPPFWNAKKPIEVMERHLRHQPPPLGETNPQRFYPPALQTMVQRALAKNPAERYQDAREFFQALKDALALEEEDNISFESEKTVIGSWAPEPFDLPAPQGAPPPMGGRPNAPQPLPDARVIPPNDHTAVEMRRPDEVIAHIRQQNSSGQLPQTPAHIYNAPTTPGIPAPQIPKKTAQPNPPLPDAQNSNKLLFIGVLGGMALFAVFFLLYKLLFAS